MLCQVCRAQPALEMHGQPLRSLSGEHAGPLCRACLLESLGPWLVELKRTLRARVPDATEEQLAGVDDWVVNTILSMPYPGDDRARAEWVSQQWQAASGE